MNFSRAQLAAAVGVDKSLVSRWLSGQVTPSSHNLARISDALAKIKPGFNMTLWDRPRADFERFLGISSPVPEWPTEGRAAESIERDPQKDSRPNPSKVVRWTSIGIFFRAIWRQHKVAIGIAGGLAIAASTAGIWLLPALLHHSRSTISGSRTIVSAQPISVTWVARPAANALPRPTVPRLAVMPFENLSPDPNSAFFADGMQEEILSTLASLAPGLEVISRTTMMSYKNRSVTVEQVARELGCTHVLEGSVRREGDHVRLTLQLINARTDDYIWSQNYDRTLVNAMAIQTEVANKVAAQLSIELASGAAHQAPASADPIAEDDYLKALLTWQSYNRSQSAAWVHAIEALLGQAIERDRDFAAAYALRSLVRQALFSDNYSADEAIIRLAKQDLDSARQRAPEDRNVLSAQAQYQLDVDQNYEEAYESFLAIRSNEGTAYAVASLGRLGEALTVVQHWATLDPENGQTYADWSDFLWIAKRPIEALRLADVEINRFHRPNTELYRGGLIQEFTGDTAPLRAALDQKRWTVDQDFAATLEFRVLRANRRYDAFLNYLSGLKVEDVRMGPFSGLWLPHVGRMPIANYRGWTELLSGDRSAAASDGRKVIAFARRQKNTKWNDWFLRSLLAEGYALQGDDGRAIKNAKELLAAMPRSRDAITWRYAAAIAARVFAWSGDKDQADSELEELANAVPGVGPALIARDSLYSVPLADDARYLALKGRLETQMATSKLSFPDHS